MKNLVSCSLLVLGLACASQEGYAQTTKSAKQKTITKVANTKTPREITIEQLTVFMTEQVNRKEVPDFDPIGTVLQANVDKGIITEEQAWELSDMTESYFAQLDANIAFKNKLIAMLQQK
jgi:hypothetical protein